MNGNPGGTIAEDILMICDCDGVLIDSEAIAEHIIADRLKALWPRSDVSDTLRPLLGMRTQPLLERVAAELSCTIDADAIASIDAAVRTGAVQAPMIEGVNDALGAIALRKACASNSNADYVYSALTRTGLIGHFGERVFTADKVPNPKPAPDVYLAAARNLGVAPKHCVVVEDSVTGTRAAVAAGMTVLGFAGAKHIPGDQVHKLLAAGASIVFERMAQLPSLVDSFIIQCTAQKRNVNTNRDFA
ncbi:HAD family hydrolase [Paraburkholderia silvatlantica]|uniref:HAD family hydrolase n=1 Tax=Paraburkholderia silvatlantica TaxID=321895 RepID=UPI00105EB377|nr:HAD-IA family hydrolase [Paraburkholderia silvatlantica]TDQ89551.1 HAD superfamily hydrolase (TIGR01509 family) [Paraburkholderia silvatlantica]